jgi:hemolysin activation/secretion protein
VNRNYTILQANASESFFIEPLFAGWEERDRQNRPTAANEMYFSMKGQYTTDDKRLIPELEETAGGLYSVRGYPESAVAGDSVVYGTAEYRLHVPRLLGIAAPNSLLGRQIPSPPLMGGGGGFNYQPRAANTPGDWDLILKGFIDAGYVHYNQINLEQAGTFDAGLVGAGAGLEMRLRDNVTILADYGWALTPIHEADGSKNALDVTPGSGRFNFVFTLLY